MLSHNVPVCTQNIRIACLFSLPLRGGEEEDKQNSCNRTGRQSPGATLGF